MAFGATGRAVSHSGLRLDEFRGDCSYCVDSVYVLLFVFGVDLLHSHCKTQDRDAESGKSPNHPPGKMHTNTMKHLLS